MATIAESVEQLQNTDGFLVESANGDVGWVEEIWLGEADEPRALAVQTLDGRHALLLRENVLGVDREQRWVVVAPGQELLELDAPRLTSGNGLAASWGTTGHVLPAPARAHWRLPVRHVRPQARRAEAARERPERPLWQLVALLYGSLALIATLLVGLAFVVAWLVTGAAY